jgi:WD40 repeat protein
MIFAPASGAACALQKLQAGIPALLWKPGASDYRQVNVSADGRFAAVSHVGITAHPILILSDPGPHAGQVAAFNPAFATQIVRLNATGDRLAAIRYAYGGLNLYDPATGTQPATLDLKDMKKFQDIGWVGGGQRLLGLVTWNADRGNPGSEEWIVLWDAVNGKIVKKVTNRTAMDALAVAPDGNRIAEGGADKLVRIRDATTLAVLQEFRAHDGPITALAWHPTKPILASTSADLSVKIWNLETGRLLEELHGPLASPNVLAFSPSGRRLSSAGNDSTTHIWEPQSLNDQPAAKEDSAPEIVSPKLPHGSTSPQKTKAL